MARKRNDRKAQRRADAEARQAERDKRTDLEQARLLLDRPGHSFRETARLVTKGEV